ncbi:MAG: diguanylate cyclase [Candidatus Omnitrophica bacterium]|nr:diguanylate cyclase [Candidatus Omnitrophota bacterium]
MVIFLSSKGVLKRLELAGFDLQSRIRQTIPFDRHIVIVEISDADITAFGRWPWKRSYHAAMAKALKGLGAKSIYFDVLFSEPSSEEDDALVEEALKECGNVYLPMAFQADTINLEGAYFPIQRFSLNTKGIGAINIYPDIDGVLRRIPLVFDVGEKHLEQISLKIAADYAGLNIHGIKNHKLVLEEKDTGKTILVPLDAQDNFLINWTGKWKRTFKHYGFIDTLAAYKHKLEGKKSNISVEDLKNIICLVGVTAIGLYDIKPVPMEPSYPGVGIAANVIDNILNKRFLEFAPTWLEIVLIFVLALAASLLIRGVYPAGEAAGVLVVGLGYFLLSYLLFLKGIMLNYVEQLAGLLFASAMIGISNFVRVAMERQSFFKMAVTDGLTGLHNIRYFKALLEAEIALAKHDPSVKFSVVMSDVDHFKKFNDTYGHQVGDMVLKEVANALKKTVRAADVVARYGGEEMIALLRGTSVEGGSILAEKIRYSVESADIKDEKNTYKVTISLGASEYKAGDTVDSLIKKADDSLYKAKEAGRNRVYFMKDSVIKSSAHSVDQK